MPFFRMHDGSTAHISLAGPEYVIEVDGKDYRFEFSELHGPTPLNKRGDPKGLGPRHRFWHAVTQWCAGGRAVKDGRAVWSEPLQDEFAGFVLIGRQMVPFESARRLGFAHGPTEEPDTTRATKEPTDDGDAGDGKGSG
jgi:hypothetical protein